MFAVVVGDDAVHDRQTQARALAERAAERLEDAVEIFGRDADALVLTVEHAPRRPSAFGARRSGAAAALGHRAQTVGREVPDDLADLVFVGLDQHRPPARRRRWCGVATSVLLRSSVAVSCTSGAGRAARRARCGRA